MITINTYILDQCTDRVLIKIVSVSEDGDTYLAQAQNGAYIQFSLEDPSELEVGDVFSADEHGIEPASKDLWPQPSSLGVVRMVSDDGVIIETNHGLTVFEAKPELDIQKDSTVEYAYPEGITRVVSTHPVRFKDELIDDDLQEYYVQPDPEGLSFDDFGGYEDVVARAKELIETQLGRQEELREIGAKPVKGVMFTGPPGTGKTHLARIIADVSNADFYLVSGPSIVSKWVGDSEQTLRRLFEVAAKKERAIIFFDEIDSIAGRRDNDSTTDSKRVVAQLLTLLDGFEEDGNIIVIAATNRVEDIDEALLRPGRFDWEIEFPLPNAEDRHKILELRAQRLNTSGRLPLEEIATITQGWSGAVLTAIWTEAALVAAGDSRQAIAAEDLAIAYQRIQDRPVRVRAEMTNHDA